MMLNNQINNYFNTQSLLGIAGIIILSICIDVFILNFKLDENAFSKAFHYKLILVYLFFFLAKQTETSWEESKPLEATFHFSALNLSAFLGVFSLMNKDILVSGYYGVFLIFGGLAAFILINEIFILIERKNLKATHLGLLILIQLVLKVFLFSIFCLSLFIMISGTWEWDIKLFYDW